MQEEWAEGLAKKIVSATTVRQIQGNPGYCRFPLNNGTVRVHTIFFARPSAPSSGNGCN
jgi:hypothetical protein